MSEELVARAAHVEAISTRARAEMAAMGIDQAGIDRLVETFYGRIARHPTLGPVFGARLDGRWDDHLAKIKQDGQSVSSVKAPTQVYFVPRAEVRSLFSTAAHDFRNDLVTLNAGTTLYDVYATSMEVKTSIIPSTNRSYAQQRRSSAVKVGELELTSPFIASAFGDSGVFFKHQRSEDK